MPTVTNDLDIANEINSDARQPASQNSTSNAHQELGEAVTGLRALFAELDKSYDKHTPIGRSMIMAKAVEAIEGKPTLKKRIVSAIQGGTTAAIEAAVNHPVTRPVIATIKGFMNA